MTSQSNERMTGKVKWFNNTAGFGFITACDGEHAGKDIFVHYSAILVENLQYKYLIQGEYVDFDLVRVESDKHEFQAVKVTGVKGGTIMCETRRQMNELNNELNRETRYEQPRKTKQFATRDTKTNTYDNDKPKLLQNKTDNYERVIKKKVSRDQTSLKKSTQPSVNV